MKSGGVIVLSLALMLVGSGTLSAQSGGAQTSSTQLTDPQPDVTPSGGNSGRGFDFYEFLGGSTNSLGTVTKLDTTIGYNFNDYFGVDAGVPVYFVSGSSAPPILLPSGMVPPRLRNLHLGSGNGLGNAYVDLRLTVINPAVNWFSTLTGTAPTGDTSLGLSTGRVTYDWDNYFDRDFGRFRPFGDAGIANTISDTPLFFRPFSTLGLVTHLEGGASYKILPHTRLGASYYGDLPIGPQKVFFRGRLLSGGVAEAIGPARIDRDNGFDTFVDVTPVSLLTVEVGYTRSVQFALNTFSFGIAFNVGSALHRVVVH
jgi:hypothetical protein